MTTASKRGFTAGLVLVTYVLMVAANALANALPLNGRATGEVSDAYGNLFAPTGLTFAIWGVIYLLLAMHVLYQLGGFRNPAGRVNDELLGRIAVVFSVSSLANVGWIFAWHYDLIGVSMAMMLIILVCLIAIVSQLRGLSLSAREALFVRIPFSVYFGWITVATIANMTVWLVSLGWDGFGISEATWAVALIAIGAVIGIAAMIRNRDVAYGLVLVWAYLGILIKHVSAGGFDGAYPAVIYTTAACMIALAVGGVYTVLTGKRRAAAVS